MDKVTHNENEQIYVKELNDVEKEIYGEEKASIMKWIKEKLREIIKNNPK